MKRLQLALCLAVLLSTASSLFAQQPPPAGKPRRAASPPAAPGSKEEAAKQQRVLAVLRVRSFVERIMNFNDPSLKMTTLAHMANVLWKDDEPYARQLFTKALDISDSASSPEAKPRATSRRRVITLIARRDPAWAKRLTDAALSSEVSSNPDKAGQMEDSFRIANELVRDFPEKVPEFVERSLRGGVHPLMHALLGQLRLRDEAAANALFLKTLDQLLSEPVVDAELLFRLGTYVFTSPKLDGSDPVIIAFVSLRNVPLGVPDLTADRPNVPPAVVRAYLNATVKLMMRPITDPKQRQLYYVMGYFMMPKAERFAPEQVALLTAAMSNLASTVPQELTQESSYANFRQTTPRPIEERIEEMDNLPDQNRRDLGYFALVYELWHRGDFARARTLAAKIQDLNTSTQLQTLIDFGEAARMLDKGAKGWAEVEKRAKKLPVGLESTILWLGIAYASIEAGETQRAEEALGASLKAARNVEGAHRPFLMLNAATQYARFDRSLSVETLAEAVREFNGQTPEALAQTVWRERVTVDRQYREFPLRVRGVEFGFQTSMPKLAAMDVEATLAEVLKLKAEPQQAQGMMALAADMLK